MYGSPTFTEALKRWIEENIHQPLRLELVAKQAGYSRWHLQRIFREHEGETLGRYLRRRRLERAAEELLAWDGIIEDIALRYGFDSLQTFSRVFKNEFGMPPGTWRLAFRPPDDNPP